MAGAGKGIRVSGIFVPVELDLTNLDKSLKDMNQSLGQVTTTLKNAFAGDVSPATLANKLVKVTEAFGKINQGASAITRLRPFDEMIKGSEEFSKALQNISKQSGFTTAQLSTLYERTAKQAGFDQQIQGLRTLQQQYKMTAQEAVAFAKMQGATLSPEAISQFMSSRAAAEQKQGRGLAGIFTPSSVSAGAQSALAATGVVTGMYGITELVKSSYQAAMRMDNLNLSFESIYGSSAKAGAQMDFVRKISDELGMSFTDTAEGAKKLFAAARGTEVEKDANQIFKAFSTMGAALKLTGDETNSVFLAVSQMISKGKVSAEELRLQLAERMPGAVTLFAKSIGVTTKELDQMLQNGQVGLDSLRKFALEVQNTYAAGAAGAAKGMQAELNRVSNAWFDLKRAFVDAEGTASTLSIITTALKSLTAVAPEIATLASVLLKVGVASAAIAGARAVWMAFADTLAYTAVRAEGFAAAMKVIQTGLLSFIASPAGAILALGSLVGALWAASSAYKDGMDNVEGYAYSLDLTKTAANGATKEIDELNKKIGETSIKMQASKMASEMSKFKAAMFPAPEDPSYRFLQGTSIGGSVGLTQQASPFEKSMASLQRGLLAQSSALISQATDIGNEFRDNFLKAIEEGATSEQMNSLIKGYKASFLGIEADLRLQGVPEETLKSFSDFTSRILGVANSADTAKRQFDDMQDSSKAAVQNINEFYDSYEAIKKITKDTELGKKITYKVQTEGVAESLLKMSVAASQAQDNINTMRVRTEENAKVWDSSEKVVSDFSNAINMLGEDAIKNKSDLSILEAAVVAIGGKFTWAANALAFLQGRLSLGLKLAGEKTTDEIVSSLQIERLMASATSGQKRIFSILSSKVSDEASKLDLAKAVLKESEEDVLAIFKNTAQGTVDISRIFKEANLTANEIDEINAGKKIAGNYESINSALVTATKTLDTWNGKLDKSKSEVFAANMKAQIEGIDKALRSGKGTPEQIDQLKKLRAQIEETGAARMKQIDAEEGAKAGKKASANWESLNSTIEATNKTLDQWKGKVDESKSDQFGATIVSEVEKIDKAIRSSKGNSEQLAQLRSLREEILRTGELRKQQIKEEQDLQNRKELTRTGSRITKEYKSLVGVDNSEVFTAAKMQYDLDAEYFQKALEKKIISEEEYATYIKMMDATLADARLRSQTDMFSRLQVAANDYYKKYGDFTKHIGDVVTTAMDSSAKAIAAFARSGASDFASLASAFASMAENIYKTATDLFAQQAVSAIWNGLGSWIGGGGVGADTGAASDALARENISYGMQANGGVFGGGSLSSFSGSIVSSPTLFSAGTKVPAYATGAGLMGEAGPEGIFPLTRVNGKLGVRAEMGASQPTILNQAVNVNVNNTSGSQVTTQQTKDNQGNINIDVMIEEAVGKSMRRPGSSPYKSLQSNFGARQQLASV